MPFAAARMADGRWQMADGRWQMADGRWQMADGRWQMARLQRFCPLRSPLCAPPSAQPPSAISAAANRRSHFCYHPLGSMGVFENMTNLFPIVCAAILLVILIVSFRSRALVFCEYLETMTGIKLKPSEVRRVYREKGAAGVREMFLDLIIREDLKEGPIDIPDQSAM